MVLVRDLKVDTEGAMRQGVTGPTSTQGWKKDTGAEPEKTIFC